MLIENRRMPLKLRRIILFTRDMAGMAAFYGDKLGLPLVTDDDGFKEFDAGGCRIALHNGASEIGARPPKIVFHAEDVAAMREALLARGVKLGKLLSLGGLDRCEAKDPDGNPIQISNRK
jgi:catechol 2,3-dioxygenase-like lactoylglutathione lyase family enzyme